jgi:hypothetical protein
MEKLIKPTSKKKLIDDNFIISKFMDHVLNANEEPKNVFLFCKENKISEADFYTFFGSIDALKKEIWLKFFENATEIMKKEEAYDGYTFKNKLLTLYFTLFELFTANRSFILFLLPNNKEALKNLKSLSLLRRDFKEYVVTLLESGNSEMLKKSAMLTNPILSEGAWIQFLAILKFWLDDTSKSFESTDILIEKSVNTVVDLLNTKPLESLLDLGKFLWKEKNI